MLKVAIIGYGNIGRYALQAIGCASDMECAGVVRRNASREGFPELEGIPVVSDIRELARVDTAILCVPSRAVEENALKYLSMGINTVDSFDIHTEICDLRTSLGPVACRNGVSSIISAGWDPGTDSVVRSLMQAMAPQGKSYTNFGPGRSMGHSVAAKAVPGVKNALSMTLPAGKGVHDRHVYVELEEGADFATVAAAIKSDPYFVHDRTEVELVPDVEAVNTHMHGVNLVREGASGTTQGQQFGFRMRINNPALTAQILVAAARATITLAPGCYTMIEVPPIAFLEGEREALIRALV